MRGRAGCPRPTRQFNQLYARQQTTAVNWIRARRPGFTRANRAELSDLHFPIACKQRRAPRRMHHSKVKAPDREQLPPWDKEGRVRGTRGERIKLVCGTCGAPTVDDRIGLSKLDSDIIPRGKKNKRNIKGWRQRRRLRVRNNDTTIF